jgi:hypothetical protein
MEGKNNHEYEPENKPDKGAPQVYDPLIFKEKN